ncbi:hypothetical protein Dxin01_04096 [Deinococcus xinjiangensis]|uniref:Uncharacterized protein n=1 Tax=Deinococcus xinjiangensis TaxID=457454 RepID=A0ABP9VHU6_9DEIO
MDVQRGEAQLVRGRNLLRKRPDSAGEIRRRVMQRTGRAVCLGADDLQAIRKFGPH